MKICILDKRRSIVGWAESATSAWRARGHTVLHLTTRNPRLHPALERALYSTALGALRARYLANAVRAFGPDLLVATHAFSMPLSLLDRLARPGQPPIIGWVGDIFGEQQARCRAQHFTAIGYTDSSWLERHKQLGLACPGFYLPHAAAQDTDGQSNIVRDPRLLFVAMPTPWRREVVKAVKQPINVYGPNWADGSIGPHAVSSRRLPLAEVTSLYRRHSAVLNIHNEQNVVSGLNQRSFDPYLCGAAVVSDAQSDLEKCFDPGTEVLVWQDVDELNATYERLLADPAIAAQVADRGRRRVLAQHTYEARLERMKNEI